jgi:ABC-type transport system involved in multi-copper enzyme maturation permease subunit
MIKLAYMGLIWKNNRGFAIFSMVFITFLQFLILYLITTIDTTSILTAILEQLPEKMRLFLNDSFFNTLTFDGAAAFGFNHPLVLALLAINAINIPIHHITHEIETGTLELLLAHPFRRERLISTLWCTGNFIILTIIIAALVSSFTSIILFHQLSTEIIIRLLQISFNLWLLFVLIFTYTLMITVFSKVGSKAGNMSAIITLVFYLLNFLSQLWDALKFTQPFNIFSYYEPQKLMFGQGNFGRDIAVLCCLIIICFAISVWKFGKRDIP